MREITSDEVCKLEKCLLALAAHHNKVSVNFKGCYPKTPIEQTIQHFSADLDRGRSYIAVAESNDSVIGFCKINIDENTGVLEYLVVLEDHRGLGCGASLIEWALRQYRMTPVHQMRNLN